MAHTPVSNLVVFANTKTFRFVRFATKDTVERVKCELFEHISQLDSSLEIVMDVDERGSSFHMTRVMPMRFTNICVKIEHFDMVEVHRHEILPYRTKMIDGFGEFMVINSRLGNIRTCAALTYSSVRAARTSADTEHLIAHTLNPDCIRSVRVHMMIATKNLGHPIIIQGFHAATWLGNHTKWKGRVRILV